VRAHGGSIAAVSWGLRPHPAARGLWLLLFTLLAVIALVPLVWMVATAFKPSPEIFASGLWPLPRRPTLDHFERLIGTFPILRVLWNTLVVALGISLLELVTSLLAAYGFARFRFPLREPLFWLCLGTMFIPVQVVMISNYLLVGRLGLLDTATGVILPQAASGFGIFLLRQHLRTFPQSIIDAARLDGASELGVLLRVVAPALRPILAALFIIFFINAWNQYVWPTVVLVTPERMTLPIWLRQFMHAEAGSDWGLLMAAASLGVLPALGLYLAAQRLVLDSLAGAGMRA
jgi:sn-glycerol 3-phosphate transport system permease protein